jgi:Ca2+-binding RTX toxin-like protein
MALPVKDVTSTSANETFSDYEMYYSGPIGDVPGPTVENHFLFDVAFGSDTIVTGAPRQWMPRSSAGLQFVDPYVIKLGAGIDPTTVTLSRLADVYVDRNPLAMTSLQHDTGWEVSWSVNVQRDWETQDTILVKDFFSGSEDVYNPNALHGQVRGLVSIEFANGVVWSADEVLARLAQSPQPEAPFHVYQGSDVDETIMGSAGRDTLYGLGGNDVLDGLQGRDELWGGQGNDTLYSGGEGDILHGGEGNDRYMLFGGSPVRDPNLIGGQPTAGPNVVIMEDQNAGEDTVVIGLNMGASFSLVNGSTLRITTGDPAAIPAVDILGFVGGTTAQPLAAIEHFILGDGSTLSGQQVLAMVLPPPVLNLNLVGGAGNDFLEGKAGNDTLSGGRGDDTLVGGGGNDTYRWARGDGWDVVYSNDDAQGDVVELGVNAADAVFLLGNDGVNANLTEVHVALKDGTGGVDLRNLSQGSAFPGGLSSLTAIRFADGTVVNAADFASRLTSNVVTGGRYTAWVTNPSGATLTGGSGADQLYGLMGSDSLVGGAGNDSLVGGAGNDTLQGDAGADTLRGGQGADLLVGGKGADTYVYARGDGRDTIVDTDSSWFVNDTLKLTDITSRQLWFARQGNDLDIQVIGSNGADDIHVQNWFGGSANQVERIVASDGKTLSASKVQGLVNAMASLTPPAAADISATTTSTSLNKLVASSWV